MPLRPEQTDFPWDLVDAVCELCRFLELVNFYHRFLLQAANTLHPLHWLCQECYTSKTVEWTPVLDAAFVHTKQLVASAALLHHPLLYAPLCIICDSSKVGAGTALEQLHSGTLHICTLELLLFFSQHFTNTESKYSTFDRELLAAYFNLSNLHRRPALCVLTDYKPLIHA